MIIWIKNAQWVNQAGELKAIELMLQDGMIIKMDTQIEAEGLADLEVIDAKGALVTPGLIDLHVHLREPGQTYKETIKTGSEAAAHGGFTTICAMPNTNPVPDTVEKMLEIQKIIKRDACVKVKQYAPITEALRSEKLVDQKALLQAGAFAFTNDGAGVQTAGTMYLAMQEAAKNKTTIVAHTEDDSLLFGGVMHEGEVAKKYNLPGILSIAEASQIARDVLLSEATGAHYHICHVSCQESVRVIRDAKRAGIKVTAEVAPHHLLLTDEDIPGDNGLYKMNPPLRGKADREALIAGLKDGTIDVIATDHAPHAAAEKEVSMLNSAFGIVGSEHAFQLLYTAFVKTGIFSLKQLVDWMTCKPADLFQLNSGRLEVGKPADLALFALDEQITIKTEDFKSKSYNTPFLGQKVYAPTVMTFVDGKIVYQREEV